jgi:hypothetical protein
MVFPMEVAFKEGWNPGLYDGAAFYQADPGGFFLAEWGGGIAGGISVVCYEERLAYIGGHFVLPPFRGKGIGRSLWEWALTVVGERAAALNGLPEGRAFYESYGFQPAYNVIRYGGEIFGRSCLSGNIRTAQDLAPEDLLAYDSRFFGWRREKSLRAWLEIPGLESACCVREGELKGWGAMRRCRQGWRLGPVFADRPEYAEEILCHLGRKTMGEDVLLDLPETNTQAIRLAFSLGMVPHSARLRLYRGEAAIQPAEGIYAFTSLDIG